MKRLQTYFSFQHPMGTSFLAAFWAALAFLFIILLDKLIFDTVLNPLGHWDLLLDAFGVWVLTSLIFYKLICRMNAERLLYETDLKEANQKLKEQAITDGMTGIYNYRYFELKLEKEWQRRQRFGHSLACVMIDIDNFKKVNDKYGHQAGDLVLEKVAETLLADLRTVDVVTRYGGEEFAIILPEKPSHRAGLLRTLERIREAIAGITVEFKGQKIKVTASLGAALLPNAKIRSPEDLVHCADQAMYAAKKSGKNCCKVWSK